MRTRLGSLSLGLSALILSLPALASGDSAPPFRPPWVLQLPPRPRAAEGGSAFLARLRELSPAECELETRKAILSGNVPDFERELEPVWLDGVDRRGARHTAVIYALKDYLAVGSDEDFTLVPMTPGTAQLIADATGTLLPTRKMVDAIYASAGSPMPPRWIPGGPVADARDRKDFEEHKRLLDEQRRRLRVDLRELIAGDKKDMILAQELLTKPGRVALYGWHRKVHDPVQPLATIHSSTYVDYSHGARLIAQTVLVDGELRSLHEVLGEAELSWAVSDEGPLKLTRYPVR